MLGQGAVVLLITDGLDREGGDRSGRGNGAAAQVLPRLIWLNPLLRYDGYEPKSQGNKAMLPHVDEFRPVHNLESLPGLIAALGAAHRRAPTGGWRDGRPNCARSRP